MREAMISACFAILFLIAYSPLHAQIEDPADKTKNEGEHRVNKNVDKGIDKGFDKVEEGIGNLFKKKKKKDKGQQEEAGDQQGGTDQDRQTGSKDRSSDKGKSNPELVWAKYDFVPGDQIIFEDNQIGEENGEFPSRWDLVNGNVENAVFGGENVIMFRGGHASIVPYLKNPDRDYLPDVFTIEFDLYLPNNWIQVYFWDRKNQKPVAGSGYLSIDRNSMTYSPAKSALPQPEDISNSWAHISIAFTNGKFKAYINETRLINIPHAEFNPTGLTIHSYHCSDQNRYYIKNIRIAEGGVKYYDRMLQDGKIIANGIRFDVNKATLKPESMGVINEICDLMKDNPDLKFSVEGHTDSDGETDFNQKLSEERAQTVVKTLENMGIASDRLTAKGWGETKPITGNDTPEGKATNRRVEFVKM